MRRNCPRWARENPAKLRRAVVRKMGLRALFAVALTASAVTIAQQADALKLNSDRLVAAPAPVENSNDPSFSAALSHACPDILGSPAEYDDALIALCLKAWRRP
jgi:hypothetical protein